MFSYDHSDEDSFSDTISVNHNFDFDNTIFECHSVISEDKKPLAEKSRKKKQGLYKHVPHKERSPQVVAKRNARERRRVQAVNNAFVKLRNVVPIQNSRGKRISKVKTLLHAMEYIRALDRILEECTFYDNSFDMISYDDNQNSGHNCCVQWYKEDDGLVIHR